jgi:hypothetical protein
VALLSSFGSLLCLLDVGRCEQQHRCVIAKLSEPDVAANAEDAANGARRVTMIDALRVRHATDRASVVLHGEKPFEVVPVQPIVLPESLVLFFLGIGGAPGARAGAVALASGSWISCALLEAARALARLAPLAAPPLRRGADRTRRARTGSGESFFPLLPAQEMTSHASFF